MWQISVTFHVVVIIIVVVVVVVMFRDVIAYIWCGSNENCFNAEQHSKQPLMVGVRTALQCVCCKFEPMRCYDDDSIASVAACYKLPLMVR